MDGFAGVILGPGLHLPAVPAAPFVGQEAQVAVPGGGELAVGLQRGTKGGFALISGNGAKGNATKTT